jgi:hypothetical protein
MRADNGQGGKRMNQLNAFCTNGSSPPRSRFPGCFPGQVADNPADFLVADYGTLFLLQPLTDRASAWVEEHLAADRLTWGSAVVVEPRYVADIVAGIRDDGLVVRS